MCCFSGTVQSVSNTRIFARATTAGRQLLAYQMKLSAAEEVAMILPLPVPHGTADGAVRFIDLEGYGAFFDDLKAGFPEPRTSPLAGIMSASTDALEGTLPVERVGSFEASFVPGLKDFARLDSRFRIPETTWDALPAYKSFGFAVFKLKKEAHTFHPMAFEFPTADPSRLFFPTVHIHDGKVHPLAFFDHELYGQFPQGGRPAQCRPATPAAWWQVGWLEPTVACDWRESDGHAHQFMKVADAKGLVDGGAHCYLLRLWGDSHNQDTWG